MQKIDNWGIRHRSEDGRIRSKSSDKTQDAADETRSDP